MRFNSPAIPGECAALARQIPHRNSKRKPGALWGEPGQGDVYMNDTNASTENVARLAALFAGYMGAHGTHGEPYQEPGKAKWEIKGSGAKTLKQPVTLELWQQHVAGTRPLGIVLVNEKGLCSCASIDVDVYDKGDQLM